MPSPAATSSVGGKCPKITIKILMRHHATFYTIAEGLRNSLGTRCLDGVQPLCPLCRDAFAPQDIRKLCVDADGDASGSTTVAPQVDTHVQRLLGDIANTAGGSATVEQVQKVIDQCRVYHNAQPDSPVRDHPACAHPFAINNHGICLFSIPLSVSVTSSYPPCWKRRESCSCSPRNSKQHSANINIWNKRALGRKKPRT